ncbi:hypothetical protein [Mycoplasma crocodyli]|uniref:hypothetical protein n=1 Tax=Mycoplasma crocodyli TaxID=50052 RepID=UPI0002EAD841|nr:hypothetical protein [Mycoplasma crocodyli]
MKKINKKSVILLTASTASITAVASTLSVAYTEDTTTEHKNINLALASKGTTASIYGFTSESDKTPEKAIDGVSFNMFSRWASTHIDNSFGGDNYRFELKFKEDVDVRGLDLVFEYNHILNMDVRLYDSSEKLIKDAKSLKSGYGSGNYGLINYQFNETAKNVRRISFVFNQWSKPTWTYNNVSIVEIRVFGSTTNSEYYDAANQLIKDSDFYTKQSYDKTTQEINNKKQQIQGWIDSNINIVETTDKNGIKVSEQLSVYKQVMNDIKKIKDKLVTNKSVVLKDLQTRLTASFDNFHPSSLDEYKTKINELIQEVTGKENVTRIEVTQYETKANSLNALLKTWKQYLKQEIALIYVKNPEFYTQDSKNAHQAALTKLENDVNTQFSDSLQGAQAKAKYESYRVEINRIKTDILVSNKNKLLDDIDTMLGDAHALYLPEGVEKFKTELRTLKTMIQNGGEVETSKYENYINQINSSKSSNLITYKKSFENQITAKEKENLDEFTVESTTAYKNEFNNIKTKGSSTADDKFNKIIYDELSTKLNEALKLRKTNMEQILAEAETAKLLGQDQKYTTESKAKYKAELDKIVESIKKNEKIFKPSFTTYSNQIKALEAQLVTNWSEYKKLITTIDFNNYTVDGENVYKAALIELDKKYDKQNLTSEQLAAAKLELNKILDDLEKTSIRNILKEELNKKKIDNYDIYEKTSAQDHKNKFNQLETDINDPTKQFNISNLDTEKAKINVLVTPKTNNQALLEKVKSYNVQLTALGDKVSAKQKAKIEALLTEKENKANNNSISITQTELETDLSQLASAFGNAQNYLEDAIALLEQKIADAKLNYVEADVTKFRNELETLKNEITTKSTYSKIEFDALQTIIKSKEDLLLTYKAQLIKEIIAAKSKDFDKYTQDSETKYVNKLEELKNAIDSGSELLKSDYQTKSAEIAATNSLLESNKDSLDKKLNEVLTNTFEEYDAASVATTKQKIEEIKTQVSLLNDLTDVQYATHIEQIENAKKSLITNRDKLISNIDAKKNLSEKYKYEASSIAAFEEYLNNLKNEITLKNATEINQAKRNEYDQKINNATSKLKTYQSILIEKLTEFEGKNFPYHMNDSVADFKSKITQLKSQIQSNNDINVDQYNSYKTQYETLEKAIISRQKSLQDKLASALELVDKDTYTTDSYGTYTTKLNGTDIKGKIDETINIDEAKYNDLISKINDTKSVLLRNKMDIIAKINEAINNPDLNYTEASKIELNKQLNEYKSSIESQNEDKITTTIHAAALAKIAELQTKVLVSNKSILDKKITELLALNEQEYKEAEFNDFKTKVEAIKASNATKTNFTKAELDALLNQLESLKSIVDEHTCIKELKTKITTVKSENKDQYTAETTNTIDNNLIDLENVINSKSTITRIELSSEKAKIETWKSKLETNKKMLNDLYEANKLSLNSGGFSPAQITEAKTALETIKSEMDPKETIGKNEATNYVFRLNAALPTKANYINEAKEIINKTLDSDIYTLESFTIYDNAHKAAFDKYLLTPAPVVDLAEFNQIKTLKESLKSHLITNKKYINDKISVLKNENLDSFTLESTNKYIEELNKESQNLIDKETIKRAQATTIINKLENYKTSRKTNLSELDEHLTMALTKATDIYTLESTLTYKNKIAELRAQYHTGKALITKDELLAQIIEIDKAIELLETYNKALKLAIANKIKDLKTADYYTITTWNQYQTILNEQVALATGTTAIKKNEYDTSLTKLEQEISKLETKQQALIKYIQSEINSVNTLEYHNGQIKIVVGAKLQALLAQVQGESEIDGQKDEDYRNKVDEEKKLLKSNKDLLLLKITEVTTKDFTKYTDLSENGYKSAVEAFKNTITSDNEINDPKYEIYLNTLNGLEKNLKTWKEDLLNHIDTVEKVKTFDGYPTSTTQRWNDFVNAKKAEVETLPSLDKETYERIKQEFTNLEAELKTQKTNKTLYDEALNNAKKLKTDIYTTESISLYNAQIATIENEYKDKTTFSDGELIEAQEKLNKAKEKFVTCKSVLLQKLQEAKIIENIYTTESWEEYQAKITTHEAFLNDPANLETTLINTKQTENLKAIDDLKNRLVKNQQKLLELHASTMSDSTTNVANYSPIELAEFNTTMATIKSEIDAKPNATSADYKAIADKISAAHAKLSNFEKDTLKYLEDVKAANKDNDKFTSESRDKLITELDRINRAIENELKPLSKAKYEEFKQKIDQAILSDLQTHKSKIQQEIQLALNADYSSLTNQAKDKLLADINALKTEIEPKKEDDYKLTQYTTDKETLNKLLSNVETNKKVIDALFTDALDDSKLTSYTTTSVEKYKEAVNSIRNEYTSIDPITGAHVLEIKEKIQSAHDKLKLYKTALLEKVREAKNAGKDYHTIDSVKEVNAKLDEIYKKVDKTTSPYLLADYNEDISKINQEVAKLKTNKDKLLSKADEVKAKVNKFITENSITKFNPKLEELVNEIKGLEVTSVDSPKYDDYVAKLNEVEKLLETYQKSLINKIELLKKVDAASSNPASTTAYLKELERLKTAILADDEIDKPKNDDYEKQIDDSNKLLKTNLQMLKEFIEQKQKTDYPTKSPEAVADFKKYLDDLDKSFDNNTSLPLDRYTSLVAQITDKENNIKSNKDVLNELKTLLDGINLDIHTSASVTQFNTGLAALKTKIDALGDVTNEQFNVIKAESDKLIAELVTNKTDLLTKVKAEKLNSDKEQEYTVDSVAQFYKKVAELEDQINTSDKEIFKQAKLPEWNDKINKLKDNLITNKTNLTNLLKDARAKFEVNKSQYTQDIQDAFNKEANRISNEITDNPVIKWDKHNKLADDIINLDGILSNNKDALLAEIDKVLNDNYDLYTTPSTQKFLKDIVAYKERIQKTSSVAKAKLDEFKNTAKIVKEKILIPNKEELLNTYNKLNTSIKEEFYTRPSVIKFDEIFKTIKSEIDNKTPGFTKAEYAEMNKKMNDAVSTLETNKDWLNRYIKAETEKNFDEYTISSVEEFKENLEVLLSDINRHKQIDKAQASNFSDEIAKINLLLRTFKEGLLSKLNQIEDEHKSQDYSKKAYARFKKELDKKREQIQKSTSYNSPEYNSELLEFQKIEDLLKTNWTTKDIILWTCTFASGIGAIIVLLLLIGKKRKNQA